LGENACVAVEWEMHPDLHRTFSCKDQSDVVVGFYGFFLSMNSHVLLMFGLKLRWAKVMPCSALCCSSLPKLTDHRSNRQTCSYLLVVLTIATHMKRYVCASCIGDHIAGSFTMSNAGVKVFFGYTLGHGGSLLPQTCLASQVRY
jgi:hypothetical protein